MTNNQNPLAILKGLLLSRDAFLSMILPALLYLGVYHYAGLLYAVLVSGIYGIVISLTLKSLGPIALVFALFGLIELLIVTFTPAGWLVDVVFIQVLAGAVKSALVFLIFSLLGKPIPRLFAELGSPELKAWEFSQTPRYQQIWQQASAIWIVAYSLKAALLWLAYPIEEATLATVKVVSGWPLHAALLVVLVYFVQYQFSRAMQLQVQAQRE
ncbi:hypothetical protein [Motilimonas sp. E26]|uniref:hypothetical protein n=1 Tax=Motilimonas sp. E26 TaxID=2865674 RepID=UPI001E549973|nr:hypothetical protein [Motilimonas sp. E26]MCE0558385.1 hypothetical protein [Motilimonas sp. E26]